MRDDFLKNRIDEYMTDASLEKLLGLALLDLLRLAKELELKVEWIKNQDPERYTVFLLLIIMKRKKPL